MGMEGIGAEWTGRSGTEGNGQEWSGGDRQDMTIRDEISTLSKAAEIAGTTLTAEAVVDAARNRDAYPKLHAHLWEVSTQDLAAEARLSRAHKLIIQLRVVTQVGTVTRMMVHTHGTKGYRPAESVAKDVNLAAVKLKELMTDIGRARERLRGFKSILHDDVSGEIDAALERAQQTAETAMAAPAAA